MDLGAPIGQRTESVPSNGFDQGEHGAGIGAAGGHGTPNAFNTQSGGRSSENQTGFNSGLGGHHHTHGVEAADKFTGIGSGSSTLDAYSGEKSGHHGSHGHGASGEAVSGAYEGGRADNAITGQSRADNVGAGVGYGGENLQSSHSHSHSNSGALAAGGLSAGALGAGAASHGAHDSYSEKPLIKDHDKPTGYGGETGTGVGVSGGAGGHYDPTSTGGNTSGASHHSGAGVGAGVGAGAAAGAAGASGAKGHYGTTDDHETRGQPISNPEDIDTGGPHSLVYQESTGKYVHRRDL